MKLACSRSTLRGEVEIPGSKSHTIRAVAIASLAGGESVIRQPLESHDARSSVAAYRALGADIDMAEGCWTVRGFGGTPRVPEDVIDVGNSGTSLNLSLGSAALLREGTALFTGDEQIRRRPAGPLMTALNNLGADIWAARNNGCPPLVVRGTMRGGHTEVIGLNSQYVSSLLINAPLAEQDTHVVVRDLSEHPYVEMTLDWIERQGVALERNGLTEFRIPGGQRYQPVERRIPGDFSSATFFLAAGALGGNDILLRGLDMEDTQGDKAVVQYLREMGAEIVETEGGLRVRAKELAGAEFDLNATPDALPMMAVVGCFAKGTTRLVNVPQARIKETDRIAVMRRELERLGARIEELDDGLIVHESALHAGEVDGHGDHRVVMALAVAGSCLDGQTLIHGSEAVAVTFPAFMQAMNNLGAGLSLVD